MPTQNVNLPERQAEFIRESVAAGRYQNASEVVRDGLRLLEERQREEELKLKNLARLAKDGFAALDRGEYISLTTGQLDEFFATVDRNVRAKSRR
jgi:antitoxin ParD1/3/4